MRKFALFFLIICILFPAFSAAAQGPETVVEFEFHKGTVLRSSDGHIITAEFGGVPVYVLDASRVRLDEVQVSRDVVMTLNGEEQTFTFNMQIHVSKRCSAFAPGFVATMAPYIDLAVILNYRTSRGFNICVLTLVLKDASSGAPA